MSEEPLLRPEEVASVLDHDGDAPAPAPHGTASSPAPYSLREPVVISPSAEPQARARLEALAGVVAGALHGRLDVEVEVEIEGFQQQRVAAALSVLSSPVWTMSFKHATRGGMALVLPPELGLTLVELALGGRGESKGDGRGPTALEARVFSRIHGALLGPINASVRSKFLPGEVAFGEVPRSLASSGEAVGVGLLRMKVGSTEQSAMMLVTTGFIHDDTSGSVQRLDGVQVGPLASRVEKVAIAARPALRAGRVTLGDLTRMRPGDVLRFDVPTDATFELRLGNASVYTGLIERAEQRGGFRVRTRRAWTAASGKETSR